MLCLWSDQSEVMTQLIAFNLWTGTGLFSIFNLSIAIFLLLPTDCICSHVHFIKSYCFCGAQ
jgi:hypothetical protein